MKKETSSFRLDVEKKAALDAVADVTNRDKSFGISEASASCLELLGVEEQEIKRRLELVLAGDLASDEEVSSAFAKWKC